MAASERPGRGERWFLTGLGIGQICAYGSLYYGFPLIAEAMAADLGLGKPEIYVGAALGLIVAALAAWPVGVLIDRGHGRAVMSGGAVLGSLLLLLWSQVHSLLPYYLILAALGLVQAAVFYEPVFAVAARRFGPEGARRGVTALTMWGGFSSTVFLPIIQFLLDQQGWRATLVVLGAINLLVTASLNFLVIDRRKDRLEPPGAAGRPAPARPGTSEILRMPVFWALALAFTAQSAAISAFLFHLYPLLLERGFQAHDVVLAMMVIGPAQVGARMLLWLFAPGIRVSRLGIVTTLAFPLSFLALTLAPPGLLTIVLITIVYGTANGIMTIVRGIAVPEMVTRQGYGAVNGLMAIPATVTRAAAPVGAAMLWAATGSYDAVLWAITAATVVLAAAFALAVLVANRPARRMIVA
ncbi:MAG TPA: MFS transporter [Geminicoccus sp.]|uniref:MFS transporter n=1 Tax=Geminicoccus sp. TaxID=2024832 RepID=UPI002C43B69E|nr:MFS transporter [Geminicoccus sp.]HWL68381.1 MFS transporter [Geminicoccus sp.]